MGKRQSKLQFEKCKNSENIDFTYKSTSEEFDLSEAIDFDSLSLENPYTRNTVSFHQANYETLKSLFIQHWGESHPTGEFNPLPIPQKTNTTYTGEWVSGLKHGFGIYCFKTTEKIEGYWYKNKLQGKALVTTNNFCYLGQLLKGKANGPGIKYQNGTRLEGNFVKGVLQGNGSETWTNGVTHKGNFKEGAKHGTGKFEGPDKSHYEGEVLCGEIHGKGRYWVEGVKEYIGEWKANQPDGQGVFKYKDGSKYTGTFVKGKKHGFGVFE